MFFKVLSLCLLVSGAWACSKNPNGTDTKLVFWNCNPKDSIHVQSVQIMSGNQINYPIDVTKPITVMATSVNNGGEHKTLLTDVGLAVYTGWLCTWTTIPTFGLLNNLDGCQIGNNCPLEPGKLVLSQTVDLSKYSSIISALASGGSYKLQIKIKDGSTKQEICCLTVEAMIKK